MRFQDSDYKIHVKAMRKWETLDGFPEVEGYDFEQEFDFDRFMQSYKNMGIQGTNLGFGIEIINKMIDDKAKIFLSCTSNMVSSGNRELIKFLVKNKFIHVLVMSAGGVEEDIIKTFKPFVLGSFDISGNILYEKGVGRIGNIFAPFDRYLYFEEFMNPFFDRIYKEQKEKNKIFTPSEFIRELGKEVNNEDSILYWAYKNNIPVYCPALTDGAIGDLIHFQLQKGRDLYIDVANDHHKIVKYVLAHEKTGAILLGGGVSKHYILNANIFKDGLDYAVYITTAGEYDASDSGGNQQEAMSWAKIKLQAPNVKIMCEASIAFPLIVASTFAKKFQETKQ
ncbi:deoxyhypusine synthase [Candidatus Woesearchaeota archaeon]|nr:deoxyhypusine synthase [Candidatus Woesearchaeota archaeon]